MVPGEELSTGPRWSSPPRPQTPGSPPKCTTVGWEVEQGTHSELRQVITPHVAESQNEVGGQEANRS